MTTGNGSNVPSGLIPSSFTTLLCTTEECAWQVGTADVLQEKRVASEEEASAVQRH